MDVDVVRNPLRSEWAEYFAQIKPVCPWSYSAWHKGLIDVVEWTGVIIPLESYTARMYLVDSSPQELEKMCEELDHGECEWLFSYPNFGEYATPVNVLIQQDRKTLNELRQKNGWSTDKEGVIRQD